MTVSKYIPPAPTLNNFTRLTVGGASTSERPIPAGKHFVYFTGSVIAGGFYAVFGPVGGVPVATTVNGMYFVSGGINPASPTTRIETKSGINAFRAIRASASITLCYILA